MRRRGRHGGRDGSPSWATEIRYARPEEYVAAVERVDAPVRGCSFDLDSPNAVPASPALLERAQRYWVAPDHLHDLRNAFVDFLGPDFDGMVLEVGCGTGHAHEILGIEPERYVGIDVNRLFLEEGRARYPGLRLYQGQAESLPFGDSEFDCLLCSDVLIHLEDMRPALNELIRVAKGKVLLRLRTGNGAFQGSKTVYDPFQDRLFSRFELDGSEYFVHYNVLAPEDLDELLRGAGIHQYEAVDLLPADAPELGLTKVFFEAAQARA